MINEIQLVHYLNESTYSELCKKLDAPEAKHREHSHCFYYTDSPIKELQFFELDLKQPIHIFVMQSVLDFPSFSCGYDSFPAILYKKYSGLFGEKIIQDFPDYDNICCDYIEYTDIIKINSSDETLTNLLEGRCVPEQLEREGWSKFKKPQSTIKLCMAKTDDTHIEVLACAHGMALKQRIKDTQYHKFNGILPVKVINSVTEKEIFAWLYHIYGISENKKYTPIDMVSILSGDFLIIASEFTALAERLKLKAAVRYAVGHKTWKCVYTSAKTKRTIFTIECTADSLNIKACLFNIDKYLNEKSGLSEKIINQLKNNAWSCSSCNPKCHGGVPLTINGITDHKCKGGAFVFNNLSKDEWGMIIKLIEKEINL